MVGVDARDGGRHDVDGRRHRARVGIEEDVVVRPGLHASIVRSGRQPAITRMGRYSYLGELQQRFDLAEERLPRLRLPRRFRHHQHRRNLIAGLERAASARDHGIRVRFVELLEEQEVPAVLGERGKSIFDRRRTKPVDEHRPAFTADNNRPAGLQQPGTAPVLHDVGQSERVVRVDMGFARIEIRALRDGRPFDDQVRRADQIGELDGFVGRDDDAFEAAGLADQQGDRRLAFRGSCRAEAADYERGD